MSVEDKSQESINMDVIRVKELLYGHLRKFVYIEVVDDYDQIHTLVVPREEALKVGLSQTGELLDDTDNEDLEALLEHAIDPRLN